MFSAEVFYKAFNRIDIPLVKLSSQILLAFCVVILFSVTDSYTNYLLSIKVKRNTEFLERSEAIIRNSARLHKAIIEMQSAFRGFLLTQDTNFLDNYDKGIVSVPPLFTQQKELIKDNPLESSIMDSIYSLHIQWIDYADSLINARKLVSSSNYGDTYLRLFENKLKKQVGKKINDDITIKFNNFDRKEYSLRAVHGNNLIVSLKRTQTFSLIFLAMTILVGIGSTIYIVFLISRRIKRMVLLAENISRGDFTTVHDTRNDELTKLSASLNIMSARLSKNISELQNRNAELDKFAYVVSHDLKAPLRGIHNAIKWIEEDVGNELSPQMKKYLSIIPQRTKRMEDLINGLLEYARIREKTKPEKIDVKKLVSDIIEEIVPEHFSVEMHDLPVLYTERLKLEQVFTNLVSNAVKYTQHEKGRLVISCKTLPHFYEFSVKDNGIGIDPEYHEKIFEIFQTLRERNEKESTGIGLAIIKKIIDDQHCTIKVNSAVGKGTEFLFTWPRLNLST
jgi:signal transduction histidine kinase